MANPLLSDRNVEFLLREVLDTKALLALPAFAEHTLETCEMYVQSARKIAREVLYPAYKPMDEAPPKLEDGQLHVHPAMRAIYRAARRARVITATRPPSVGGASLPHVRRDARERVPHGREPERVLATAGSRPARRTSSRRSARTSCARAS